MSPVAYAIFFSDVALEICLLWRLLRGQLWKRYSYVFAYALYVLIVLDLFLFAVWALDRRLYHAAYWDSESIGVALRFLIVWEVIRRTFPSDSSLRRIACRGAVAVGLGIALVSASAVWGFAAYHSSRSLFPALERSFGLTQAVMILGVIFLARYYGVQLGRNVWGIAFGFGAYVSVSIVNFALIDFSRSFLPYWQVLVPLTFNAMLVVWIWGLWTYAPNPPIALGDAAERAAELGWWSESWRRALTAVRKVVHS